MSVIHSVLEFLSGRGTASSIQDQTAHSAGANRACGKFTIYYADLEVGQLIRDSNGGWFFSYSDEFRAQDRVRPIADFPNKLQSYRLPELSPFFVSRIPGIEQPKIQRILKERGIDTHDQAGLLKEFGRRSIANAFRLEPEAVGE